MSGRDIRDIMEIQAPVAAPGLTVQPSRRGGGGPPDPRQKRPDGITRELYALIGDNAPSLALAQVVKPKFKERIKRAGPSVKWQWTGFTNPSREVERASDSQGDDGVKHREARKKLVLRHWVRDLPADHVDPSPDTKFTKFNTSSNLYTYSDDEYDTLLKEDGWTKEETDYLFNMAKEYDVRFIVMADRWDFSTERSVDDLKARYYSVCRRLARTRPAADEQARNKLLQDLSFDRAREVERKNYLRSLLSRTPAQVAEEDFLYIESRRLEQSYNKMTTERAELLRILGGREGIGAQGGLSVGVGGGAKGSGTSTGTPQASSQAKKKGQPGWEIEGLDGGGLPEGWAGEGSKRKATAAQDAALCIERHPAPSVSATKATLHPSVSLRSSRITQPKPAALTKVQTALAELGISTHLIMPTKNNIEKLDTLQSTLQMMVDLKKSVDRAESEIRTLKLKKDKILGTTETTIKEEEGEDKRGNKRSASVSSSGTNKRARKE
ncbi:DNA methyltransferase 1-associated protein 1 [Pseudohyphozyma bogoriensis]|nr:DNA methyltransferase 1-associated protein 1 [Pseudohyphozyma bogoriensis]